MDDLAGPALDVDARARVIDAADGNPLFVEELLALALDERDGTGLTVPPSIQALLAARLDRLADDEHAVLERASVEGKAFHGGYVIADDDAGRSRSSRRSSARTSSAPTARSSPASAGTGSATC